MKYLSLYLFICSGILSCSDGVPFIPADSNPCDTCKEGEVCSMGQCVSPTTCEDAGGVSASDGSCQICGDRTVTGSEECDDVNDGQYGGCMPDCTLADYCGGDSPEEACEDGDVCTQNTCVGTSCISVFDADICNRVAFVVPPTQTVFVDAVWPEFSIQVEDSLGHVVSAHYPATLSLSGALSKTVPATLDNGMALFSNLSAQEPGAVTVEVSVPLIGTVSSTVAVIDTAVSCADGSPCETGMTCNESWGICVMVSCKGQADFTPCEVVTDPDYSYDICVAEVCTSPGCGDASCNTPAPNFPLADTGARTCYGPSYPLECPNNRSDDYYGQDAQEGWDSKHESTDRFAVNDSSGNRIIEDQITGLEWEGCVQGYEDCSDAGQICTGSSRYCIWREALSYCDSLNWGGQTDWRLPDLYELLSIVDFSKDNPAVDPAAFTDIVHPPVTKFWTSLSAATPNRVLSVDFDSGKTETKSSEEIAATRCVRSKPHVAPPIRFERLEGAYPTVRDNVTKLMWQGCLGGSIAPCSPNVLKYDWVTAMRYCKNLSWGSYSGWRMPNATEAQSLINYRKSEAVDLSIFPDLSSSVILWTATPSVYVNSVFESPFRYLTAWQLSINGHHTLNFSDKGEVHEVTCVRGL